MKLTRDGFFGAGRRLGLGLELVLGLCLMGALPAGVASAQGVSTTTVQGTVYLANGQAGTGTLNLSWPSFATASGQAIAAGQTNVTIAADGFVSVNLAPNVGATPAGLYYTAIFQLSDGSANTQYWVVPAASQATLAQVQSQVMPAAQAVQAVSKSYVDQTIAELEGSLLTAAGGTLTGNLYLNGDPTQPLQAADKHYVDNAASLGMPLSGGTMTGPISTPGVNGVQAPAVGSSQTTLQAAVNAAGTNGAMEIPPTYAGTDGFTNPQGVYVTDLRQTKSQQFERSVKEFGAVCDGATDDTNALQSAINYAQTHGVALTIPQGTCKTRTLIWHGESIGGLGKQVSALMGFPGQDVLATTQDSVNLLSYTRLHDLTIYVDQSLDVSCTPAKGRAPAGSCQVNRPMESNSIFSPGGNGLNGTVGTGAAWAVGNCAIAMQAVTGAGGNGLKVADLENLEILTTGADPMAQYAGAHSTHTCGMYLAQWPQWSEFRNIDISGLNTGIAIPALAGTTPAGLLSDSNRWEDITIQGTHGFTATAGSHNVLDNLVVLAGNSAATGEPPTGIVLDFAGTQQGWIVRTPMVNPLWNAVQPQFTVTAAGGAVTGVTVGTEHGLGFDPYGAQVPLAFSGSCTAQATATVNSNVANGAIGAIGSSGAVTVTQGGVGCSGTTTASVNVAGTWDTAAPVNLISGQNMSLFGGNLLRGTGGYTVWNAAGSQSYGTQLAGGGGNLPGGGSYAALVGISALGTAYPVDQFPGIDFGAKLQACVNGLSATYGGTCDARNLTGIQSMGSSVTIATANATLLLPCATISTANQIIVTAGTRNVTLRGCALRGASTASGSQGGTVFLYSGTGAMVQVGDPTYAADTSGFHMDDAVINTTASTSASAKAMIAYRTQELDIQGLYLLGNSNQTGITLDGTGNYTGGSFYGNQLTGFQTGVNAIGHQVANAATTDWMNASTFVRLHIDCPTSGGNPIAGTTGINLQQGDGNTFTGGDVESCTTALHLGANAQNNTIVGLRNENSSSQVVADAGSSYNNWMTGGTMFTGKLTDNGTRNSFLDTFHRTFNGMNGDWYGSQQDATVTNHWRLGIGTGNERGLLNEIQTDYGYRWVDGYTDATAGEQYYQVQDLLNNVPRLSIGQYNNGQSSTNNQTVLNSAGTGAVVLNGTNNSGTGGVVFGSGGASETTVATIDKSGDAQFTGTLQVTGATTLTATPTVKNQADAEIDAVLWAGVTGSQKESLVYKDWNGNSQWYAEKDQNNNWMLNSALGGLDSFKAYQSTNSGDTYINASNSTGHIRLNYEPGSGSETDVYAGGTLIAKFSGLSAIEFPGLATTSGYGCAQLDGSGWLTNSGSPCSTASGTVGSGNAGQIAYYTGSGTALSGLSAVPVTAGGTGAATAAAGLAGLGGVASTTTVNGHALSANVTMSASDLTTGTLPHAQLPALVSGDVPNNAANTTGTAGNVTALTNSTLTSLPSLALGYSQLTGTVPTWNQNTTGTAGNVTALTNSSLTSLPSLALPYSQLSGTVPTWNQSTTGTAGNVTALTNSTLTSLPSLALGYSQLSGTVPTWNQNTTGTAGNVTALTNSSLTSLPSLALGYSQLSGTVPTWNQNTTGTAGNVTGTVAVGNGGTGAATPAAGLANLGGQTALGYTPLKPANNLSDVSVAATALANLGGVAKTITVNGNALSGNVTVTASQLTTGTLPHAQLPPLVSGDVPNNAANTSGTAANVTGTVAVTNGGTGAATAALGLAGLGGVASTTTVNGHALSASVTVSASDLTTGTLPHAQLPSLVSGDIPNNAANTSGTATNVTALSNSTLTSLPSLALPYSQLSGTVPTWNQSTTGTASNVTALTNSTLTSLPSLALPYSQLSGTVPTWNQSTTGTASNVTALTNSTLTSLPSLGLPYSQLSGTVPTWNQSTTGTAANVTGTVAIGNGGTGAATAALGLAGLGGVATTTTVNGHALSASVTVSASDLTTGTLPHAQLPALVSGDIPNNAANTGGTASNVTALSNSTLTSLPSLALPYAQLSGTVPTWNQSTTGTAVNVTGTVAIGNGGTGAATAALGLVNLGGQAALGYAPLNPANNLSDVSGAALALANLGGVATTTSVNGHALSANVTVSASDLTTGTLPHAQLPALLSGDIPGNSANTSGTASNVTALTNSTLTSLPSLGLPYSQLSGTVPTWNQNSSGTAANVTGTVAIGNGGTGAATAALGLANLGAQAALGYTPLNPANNLSDVSGAALALVNLGGVATTTTVNGHALSANVTVSASDLTTGTLPHAQLPVLVSGDVPSNAANTSGTAANVTALSNSTLTSLPSLALPYSQLSGTVPTWNQSTTGTASNLTALINSTLTSLPSLALPYSQLSGTVPTWNQNTSGTATNVTGTVAIGNGGTGAATAALGLAGLGGVATTTTVNGHALSVNVTVSASDLTTGTLPHAQLPVLVSGDIPNNAANTSGTAANVTTLTNSTLTSLPSLALPYSQLSGTVPTWNQNTSGTATNVTGTVAIGNGGTGAATAALGLAGLGGVATTTSVNGHALSANVTVSASDLTMGTLPHAQLPALVSGDIPNNAANTSGTASNITSASNSTLTSLPSLALPYSQLSGTVPTWNQSTTGTAGNVTGTVTIGNGGTGAATAALGLANLGGCALAGCAMTGPLSAPSINNVIHVPTTGTDLVTVVATAKSNFASTGFPQTIQIDPGVSMVESHPVDIGLSSSGNCINLRGTGSSQNGVYNASTNPLSLASSIVYTGSSTVGGWGYTSAPTVNVLLAANYSGSSAVITANGINGNGQVTGLTVSNGGTGYDPLGTYITFTGGGPGYGANAIVSVNTSGVITAATLVPSAMVIKDLNTSYASNGCILDAISFDGANLAGGAVDISGMGRWKISDLYALRMTHEWFSFGRTGASQQNKLYSLEVNGRAGATSYAVPGITMSGDSITSISVTSGGAGYINPVVLMYPTRGWNVAAWSQQCQNADVLSYSYSQGAQPNVTATINGSGVVTAYNLISGGTNCGSALQPFTLDLPIGVTDQYGAPQTLGTTNTAAAYGYHFYPGFTDNDVYTMNNAGVGIIAGVKVDGGGNRFYNTHVIAVPNGFIDLGKDSFYGGDCDTIFRNCFIETKTSPQAFGMQQEWNYPPGLSSNPGVALIWNKAGSPNLTFQSTQCFESETTWNSMYQGNNRNNPYGNGTYLPLHLHTSSYNVDVANCQGSTFGTGFQFPVIISSGTQTISGCSLASALGGSGGGSFNSGTSGTCTATITPGTTVPTGFQCMGIDHSTGALLLPTGANSQTTCTIAGTTTSGDLVTWTASAF